MNVKLLTSTESFHDMEKFAALAALTCHANTDKDYIPADVLKRIIRLGHESIEITLRYAHLFPSKQTEMIERLEKERAVKTNVS